MASLIPVFEYDIFISYRQKDNKGDKWVSEFVESLRTELSSTFKEDISIYFDVSPHDGLLETHDVDASLKEKLRCAIFMPVLSRTYCDPTSFAWEHEFKSFVKQASQDQYGLNVMLSNGNTTSRILPVRIHDLDPEDMRLLESEIDLIHPVDFIYYSDGVNRPLRKQDDLVQDPKQLIYRDQVNKTALAVKEIIVSLKGEKDLAVAIGKDHSEKKREFYEVRKPSKSVRSKMFAGVAIFVLLVLTALFIYPGIIGRKSPGKLITKDGTIPVAVMPFQNMTNDTIWNVWQDGIQSVLITYLASSGDLKVRKSETVNGILENQGLTNYAALTPSIAGLISRNLETTVFIQGSIKQSGSTIRVNALLANTKTGEALQSFQVDGTSDNPLPAIDTLAKRILKFLLISAMKKQLEPDSEGFILTSSPEALRYFINGTKATGDPLSALEWYRKAVEADSNFFDGLNNLWFTSLNTGLIKQGKQVCLRIYRKKDIWGQSERLWADYQYAYTFQTVTEQIERLKKVLENDNLVTSFHWVMGIHYSQLEQYDKAIIEFEKTLELCKKWQMKPWVGYYVSLGDIYFKAGLFAKAGKTYKKAEKEAPDNANLVWNMTALALSTGDSAAAKRHLNKYVSLCKERGDTEASIIDDIGLIHSEAGILDKAEENFRQALSLEPEMPARIRRLATFLIEKDRNIDEGLDLIEKYLKLRSDNYLISDVKGWGYYKKGNYKEALEILQRSWDQRMEVALYDHPAFLHLEAAKKAVAGLR